MGVRRHLDVLEADGSVETTECTRRARGRPATGWRLSAAGLELFPRRYDAIALDVLEDVAEHAGPEAVAAVFARRTDKLVHEYEAVLAGRDTLEDRVAGLTRIRDDAGYMAECSAGPDDELILTENNC